MAASTGRSTMFPDLYPDLPLHAQAGSPPLPVLDPVLPSQPLSLHPFSHFTLQDSPQTFARNHQAELERRVSMSRGPDGKEDEGKARPLFPDDGMPASPLPSFPSFPASMSTFPPLPSLHASSQPTLPAASRLSMELITLILDFALLSVDLGTNGRWSTSMDAISIKAQWGKGNKASAHLHRKLSLVHRTWTPHVLRSLYHTARLTSRRSMEMFLWCLNHPQDLWGYDGDPLIFDVVLPWDTPMDQLAGVARRKSAAGRSVEEEVAEEARPSKRFRYGSDAGIAHNGLDGNGKGKSRTSSPSLPPWAKIPTQTPMPTRPGPPMHNTVVSVLARGWGVTPPKCTVPDRKKLVKYLCFNVGTGRNSKGDFMIYSGDWFARTGVHITRCIPDLWGFETESWCTLGCDEMVKCCTMADYKVVHPKIRRWSLIRNPAQAIMIRAVAATHPNIEIVEWVDVGAHVLEPGPTGWDMTAETLGVYGSKLRVFAIRVRGLIRVVGVFDKVFEMLPRLETLMIQVNLVSFGFFDHPPGEDLNTLMIGLAHRSPVVFRGKAAIAALWEAAARRSGVEAIEVAEGDTGEGVMQTASTGIEEEGPLVRSRSATPGWHWIEDGVSIMDAFNRNRSTRELEQPSPSSGSIYPDANYDTPSRVDSPEVMIGNLVGQPRGSVSLSHHDEEGVSHGAAETALAKIVRTPPSEMEQWLTRECAKGGGLFECVASEAETWRIVEGMCW